MKTQTMWEFTPDEFAWVWSETGLDTYPYPISIIETPTTGDEYAQLRAEISARYPHGSNPDLTGPLRVLANPDLRIVCAGQFHNSVRRLRSLAAAIGDLGVILFQKSGATADFGGSIKLVVTQRHSLGKHIAATMPNVSAGAAGNMVGYTPRVRGEQPPSSWKTANTGQQPSEERIRTLLRLPRTAEGYFRIEQYLHDRRPYPPAHVSWIDVSDANPAAAGRYLIDVTHHDTTVTPASAEVIARELERRAELNHVS
ncbi:ESX secretion-associated protein EspG [Nocardia amikacinitolerans]|uniref:ESX secretion-associated protein EspG n=2 Tax=Nocardia amikacinitolerans TaxID=756689 RepID=UPI0012ED559F|nr:ESX secretion-associated protein EspG [Nocardia amikacinitolerans]